MAQHAEQLSHVNRRRAEEEHLGKVAAKRQQRSRVVQRIEAANRERVVKHEEHAKAVRRYDDHVAKLEARRELRQSLIKAEREAFQQQQAAMNDALRKSEAGTAVITDSELEAIITGEGAKRR